MKKLNFYTLSLVIFLCFGLTIGISMATGYWQVSRTATPALIAEGNMQGQYNPYDIRGSYTINEVLTLFNIPKEDFYKGLLLPSEICGDTQLKELESLERPVESSSTETTAEHFGVDDVREFVAKFIGYTGPVTTETPKTPDTPAAPNSGDTSTAPVSSSQPVNTETKTETSVNQKQTTTNSSKVNTTPASVAQVNTPTETKTPTTASTNTATANPVTPSPTAVEPANSVPPAANTEQQPTGGGTGTGTTNSTVVHSTAPGPKGSTLLSEVYTWGVTQEMLEKNFDISFADLNMTEKNTLKELSTASGIDMSSLKDYISAKMD